MSNELRDDARAIWQAAVDAVRPEELLRAAFADPALGLAPLLEPPGRILVVGAGKAGAAMAAAVEELLADQLQRVEGWVNVPGETVRPLRRIHLHAARPSGTNQPTAEGAAGAEHILDLVARAGPDDVALCLLSGGGSALLPAPAEGISLEDKQTVTRLLHACGATINEMNAVRKHLSRVKGGRLAQAFRGRALYSLIISDVVGDPLDVIASGPTTADPTTFDDVLGILDRFHLLPDVAGAGKQTVPPTVAAYLRRGAAGQVPETLKAVPGHVHNAVIGNNQRALSAAQALAGRRGYRVCNLGSFIEGETREVAVAFAGFVRAICRDGQPLAPPVCLLSGGETTVTLSDPHGKGGRNQEFVLTMFSRLPENDLRRTAIVCGGTDGEDGPTDAAGAVVDQKTLDVARRLALNPAAFLERHDAYAFFSATGDLLKTGLTRTNVMDVRVVLIR